MSQAASSQDDFSAMSMNLKMGKNPTVVRTPATSDPASASLKDNKRAYEHEMITRDYDMVIKLNPGFVYAYFNRGTCVVRNAIFVLPSRITARRSSVIRNLPRLISTVD